MGMGGGLGIPKGGKMDRKKSNSVTELVKIVAKEVMQDTVRSAVQEELRREVEMDVEMDMGIGCRLGKPWSVCEDLRLKEEVNYTLNHMANKHGRSTGAIVSRLKKHYKEM